MHSWTWGREEQGTTSSQGEDWTPRKEPRRLGECWSYRSILPSVAGVWPSWDKAGFLFILGDGTEAGW